MKGQKVAAEQLVLPAADPGVITLSAQFLQPNTHILDAGCGNGRNAIHLATRGHTVIGMDKDPAMLQEARALTAALGSSALKLHFQEGDLREPPHAPATFEAVLATRSLQELGNRRQAIRALMNLQDLTLPDGYNFITTYIGTPQERRMKPHLAIFNPGEVAEIYTEQGWDILYTQQEIEKPRAYKDVTLIRSYDEIVAKKSSDSDESSQLDIRHQYSFEFWHQIDPEYHRRLVNLSSTYIDSSG